MKTDKNASRKSKISTKKASFQKSISVESRDFVNYFTGSNGPVVEGFKKLTTEFASTQNTHAGNENAAMNTFITIQNNENEEDDKKNKGGVVTKLKEPQTLKSVKIDHSCIDVDMKEENFHHFPKEINVRKLSNPSKTVKIQPEANLGFGKKKKRLGTRAKSLQIIMDEGIIQSSLKNYYYYLEKIILDMKI